MVGGGAQADHSDVYIYINGIGMGGNNADDLEAKITAGSHASCPVPGGAAGTFSSGGTSNINMTGLAEGCEYTVELKAKCRNYESAAVYVQKYCTGKLSELFTSATMIQASYY